MRYKLFVLALVAIFVGGYICSCLYMEASRTAQMATAVSRLGEIGNQLLQYRQVHGTFPDEGFAALQLPSRNTQDPITGETFRYRTVSENGVRSPVVEQVAAFRTKLWPFGEMRRYVLYEDGSVRDVYPKKGSKRCQAMNPRIPNNSTNSTPKTRANNHP